MSNSKTVTLQADYFFGVEAGQVAKVVRQHTPGYVIALVNGKERVVEVESGRIVNG